MKTIADEIGKTRQVEQVALSTSRAMSGERDIEVDLEARDDARDALAKITSHEQLCTERWTQSREGGARIEAALASLTIKFEELQKAQNNRLGPLPVGVLTLMTGLIGFLAHAAYPHI